MQRLCKGCAKAVQKIVATFELIADNDDLENTVERTCLDYYKYRFFDYLYLPIPERLNGKV